MKAIVFQLTEKAFEFFFENFGGEFRLVSHADRTLYIALAKLRC